MLGETGLVLLCTDVDCQRSESRSTGGETVPDTVFVVLPVSNKHCRCAILRTSTRHCGYGVLQTSTALYGCGGLQASNNHCVCGILLTSPRHCGCGVLQTSIRHIVVVVFYRAVVNSGSVFFLSVFTNQY